MTKKQIYIGLGVAAGAAVIYYFWRQRQVALQQAYLLQQQAQQGQAEEGESRFGGGGGGGGGFSGGSVATTEPLTPITPVTSIIPITAPIAPPTIISSPPKDLSKPISSATSLSGLMPAVYAPTIGVGEGTTAFTSPSTGVSSPSLSGTSGANIGLTSSVAPPAKPIKSVSGVGSSLVGKAVAKK